MDIHEYQAKEILAKFGVTVPQGALAYSPEQAAYRARELGGNRWIVKAQVHACLLYTSPSPRDGLLSRMPSSA